MNYYTDNVGVWVMGCLTLVAITIIWVFIAAWIGAWIWNDVVVTKFNAPTMDYLDMFLLMVLARLLLPFNINTSKKS